MKIDATVNNSLSFQRKIGVISSLEQSFAKLKVDISSTELLENKLKDLHLEDDKGNLIERGPTPPKDTKPAKTKPYQKVAENVFARHNCGGTAFSITNIPEQNCNYIKDSSIYNNFEANNNQTTRSECFPLFECDTCILQVAYSPAFIEHSQNWLNEIKKNDFVQLQHNLEETHLNTTNIKYTLTSDHVDENTNFKTHPEFIRPSLRRVSYDSGFQSDNPSPQSDYVLSPKPSYTLQPSKIETVTSNFRKILPKTKEMQEKEKDNTNGTPKININNQTKQKNKQNTVEKTAKELFRATLNAEIKQVKWIELVVEKSNDELFKTSNCEKTVLHKLLQSGEKYTAESLYAIVEKMKMNPDRCSHIIAAQSSICDTIKQNKHPQLWLDYFCEAMQIIQHKMKSLKKN